MKRPKILISVYECHYPLIFFWGKPCYCADVRICHLTFWWSEDWKCIPEESIVKHEITLLHKYTDFGRSAVVSLVDFKSRGPRFNPRPGCPLARQYSPSQLWLWWLTYNTVTIVLSPTTDSSGRLSVTHREGYSTG